MASAAALLLAALLPATEAAIQLEPAVATLEAGQTATDLWISNTGDTPWTAEASVYDWHQQPDGEHLEPTSTLAVSPSHFIVQPGQRQRLRLIRLETTGSSDQETGYRLLLRQLADATAPDQPLLRHSSAVFIAGSGYTAPPRLRADLDGDELRQTLRLYNPGAVRARVTELTWVDPQGQQHLLLPGLSGYVLAGATRLWALPPRQDGYAGGHFQAQINEGPPQPLDPG